MVQVWHGRLLWAGVSEKGLGGAQGRLQVSTKKSNAFDLVGVKIQTIFRPRIVRLSILENKGQGLVLTRYVFYCDMIR